MLGLHGLGVAEEVWHLGEERVHTVKGVFFFFLGGGSLGKKDNGQLFLLV